jgi:hypothetical protein
MWDRDEHQAVDPREVVRAAIDEAWPGL